MSATAEVLLEQLKKLPPGDQQQILQQLLQWVPADRVAPASSFPTVKVAGGVITSEQVAETLDDE